MAAEEIERQSRHYGDDRVTPPRVSEGQIHYRLAADVVDRNMALPQKCLVAVELEMENKVWLYSTVAVS